MTLSNRILLAMTLLTISLSVGFAVSGKIVLERVEGALLSLNSENASAAIEAVLARSEKTLQTHAKTISRDRDAIAAIVAADAAILEEGLTSTFNRIAGTGEISDMMVFDAEGAQMVAFGSGQDGPAPTSKPDVVTLVLETKKRHFVIERIDENRFAATYAFPLSKGRSMVGVGLLALDVGTSLPSIAESIKGRAILAEFQSASGWTLVANSEYEIAAAAAEQDGQQEAQSEAAEQMPSTEEFLTASIGLLGESDTNVGVVDFATRSFVVTRYDLGLTVAGAAQQIYLISDFTSQQLAKTDTIRSALGILSALALVFLALMLFWVRGQMRSLKENTVALLAIAQGEDPKPRKSKSKAKEIAELDAAMDLFAQQRQSEKMATDEIASVVAACAEGNFTLRLCTEDKQGVFLDLCDKVNQIGEAANEGLEAIRDGLACFERQELVANMPDHLQGVFGEIALSMNATARSLSKTMRDISASSFELDGSAGDISEAARDLAVGTEKNAAKLEDTATSIEAMSVSVKSAAKSGQEVYVAAGEISKKAAQGRDLMDSAVSAMQEIETSSNAIVQIIEVIEGIGFQTSLLALNASVEAARAGEAGKGFSVVASEVRSLSQRTAESAREVADLVKTSRESVLRGSELVNQSGSSFGEIVEGVERTVEKINEIVVSAKDTAQGVEEIGAAAADLESATQRNAAIAEQTSATAINLNDQSSSLSEAVSVFKLADEVEVVTEKLAANQ